MASGASMSETQPPNNLTITEVVNVYKSLDCNKRATCRKLKIHHTTLKRMLDEARAEGLLPKSDPKFKVTEGKDCVTVFSKSHDVTTVEDVIRKANIDLDLWEITETEAVSWDVVGKRNLGQQVLDDGKVIWREQELWREPVWQIKVKLRRKAPKFIQEGIRKFLEDITKLSPSAVSKYKDKAGAYLAEISLYDVHFGKLCHRAVAGHDWDLSTASDAFDAAGECLVDRVKAFDLDRIVIPIGHDYFNANNWDGTTKKGTKLECLGNEFAEVFRVGVACASGLILRCADIAPVRVIWVPGNHDVETSWYLLQVLSAYFKNNKNVTFDDSSAGRKYFSFGSTLFGYTHADDISHRDLPNLMANEVPDLWGMSRFRAWRVGHYHSKRETSYTAGDSYGGTRIEVMPSMSGTDNWHYSKGFVKNVRTGEAWLWHIEDGYVGHFSSPPILD